MERLKSKSMQGSKVGSETLDSWMGFWKWRSGRDKGKYWAWWPYYTRKWSRRAPSSKGFRESLTHLSYRPKTNNDRDCQGAICRRRIVRVWATWSWSLQMISSWIFSLDAPAGHETLKCKRMQCHRIKATLPSASIHIAVRLNYLTRSRCWVSFLHNHIRLLFLPLYLLPTLWYCRLQSIHYEQHQRRRILTSYFITIFFIIYFSVLILYNS